MKLFDIRDVFKGRDGHGADDLSVFLQGPAVADQVDISSLYVVKKGHHITDLRIPCFQDVHHPGSGYHFCDMPADDIFKISAQKVCIDPVHKQDRAAGIQQKKIWHGFQCHIDQICFVHSLCLLCI